jgi:hypothetical protein
MGRVIVENIVLDDPTTAAFLDRRMTAGDDPVAIVNDAIEVGARVLEREQAAVDAAVVGLGRVPDAGGRQDLCGPVERRAGDGQHEGCVSVGVTHGQADVHRGRLGRGGLHRLDGRRPVHVGDHHRDRRRDRTLAGVEHEGHRVDPGVAVAGCERQRRPGRARCLAAEGREAGDRQRG